MNTAGPRAPPTGPLLTIVGIGASAGGLEAFKAFFTNLPSDSGLAFVVILHLPAHRKSMLADILRHYTDMTVREVRDDDRVEANTVYIPPAHMRTVVRGDRLGVSDLPADGPRDYRPIDSFFDSLADNHRERAIGIVLSGTGTDGALGLKAIRACGGLTMAQRFVDDDAQQPGYYNGMPAGAIATGAVDILALVEEMPVHLARLAGARLEAVPETDEDVEAQRQRICARLRERVGHDFSDYKRLTFLRRVHRRMQVLDLPTVTQYAGYLETHDNEPLMLFCDLLIRVTSFFRDAEAFDIIERLVIPRLFKDRHADGFVRIWVPGCSTGEEAYSLAMLVREHLDTMRGPPRVQIFATDIDEPAIGTARLGRYPAVLLEGLSGKRRERFFTRSDSGYAVAKEIRDLCTFSAHSLVRDPPFSRIDLVSCRNLLIYLDTKLQAKVIPAFHYALSPNGMLILGTSESTSRHEDLFEQLDKTARIFQRRNVRTPAVELNRRNLQHLAHPERSSLQPRSALAPAPAKPEPASTATPPGSRSAGRSLRRLAHSARNVLAGLRAVWPIADDDAAAWRHQLAATREELQSVSEEHETAVEELRSANEELHSVNEEMQSTNEELETSKEEIQSVNEELHTVNAQLQEKVDEVDRANSDLRNLFDSSQIATVFLDRYGIIRSFTPAIAGIYSLIPSDVGRPLSDIVSRMRYETLTEDTHTVLETRAPLERQLARADNMAHYIMRILPYRGSDSTVSGTLITFLDVTSVVRAEQHQRMLVDELNHRVKNMLTVVISIAAQTLRGADGLAAFGEAFMGRVHALAASYALLSRENWGGIELCDVIEEEVRPFDVAGVTRVARSGVAIQLNAAAALALGMAIHELATNAVKYGALSRPDGRVSISWRIQPRFTAPAIGTDGDSLVLNWVEQGGPPVAVPSRAGFGTVLMQRGLAHELAGGATLDFRPDGLHATLHAAVDRILHAGDAPGVGNA